MELYDRKMRMMIAEGKEKVFFLNMILAWECQTPSNTSGTAQQDMEGQKQKISWAYNAGQCSHHKCKFIHQCSVCKKHGHPIATTPKFWPFGTISGPKSYFLSNFLVLSSCLFCDKFYIFW